MARHAPKIHEVGRSLFHIHLYPSNIEVTGDAEARRDFTALGEGGHAKMPLMKTFWASSFGMLTDKFGVPWMVI